jgi:alcohol dehydrogenase
MSVGAKTLPDPSAKLTLDLLQRPTRLVQGVGAVDQAGALAKELGATNVLIVTDPGIVEAGHFDRLADSLTLAGIQILTYDKVRENPTTRDVDDCLDMAKSAPINCIVGLGGGSSMDTAKGCNFLLTNGGQMKDYWGRGKARKEMLPLIAIPTTAGTGSECQSFALIADEISHMKMACGDLRAAAKISILDPLLTLSQPFHVAAVTGIDALAHAVETAVTKARNPVSLLYAHKAFSLIVKNLSCIVDDPTNVEKRADLQLGAALAGMAIENSMLGAAHSCANPLTAHYNTVHGQAVGVMLPHVIRFNGEDPEAAALYHALAVSADLLGAGDDTASAVHALVEQVEVLLEMVKLEKSLRDLQVEPHKIPELAREASQQWTAMFNPREIDITQFEDLFHAAL